MLSRSFLNLFAVLAWFAFFNVSTVADSATNNNTTSIPFRIMSLGASVTFGVGSTTGDSYRKDLQDLLVANSNTVEYVGKSKNGNFTDNAVEATPGFVISQIAASANVAVPSLKPNLVLIDAGTNNCNNGGTVPEAGANITNLINSIYTQSPGTTVILTTILVNSVAAQDACRVTVNAQYETLASTLQAAGAKLVLVNMRGPGGPLVTDLADGRHPNDAGYVKMANVWFGGIQEVLSKGFLTKPSTNSSSISTNSTVISTTSSSRSSATTASKHSKTSAAASTTQGSAVATTSVADVSAGNRVIEITSFAKIFGYLLCLLMGVALA